MRHIRTCAALAGLALVGFAVYKAGSGDLLDQLQRLPIALPIVIAAGALKLWVQTRAWQIALKADGVRVPQSRLVGIRLAAQAGGYLSALGPVLAEPAKLALLRGSAAMGKAAPATLMETGSYWLTTVILGLAGTCAAALLIPGSGLLWLSAAVFGAAMLFLVARSALLSPLVRLLGPRAPAWLRSAEQTELLVRSFRYRQPDVSTMVLALEAIAQVLTLLEVAAVLWVIGTHLSVLHVLAIEASGRLVKILAAWVPARIGADEGGAAASFAALGLLPASGLTLALARRLRDLLFCAVGAAWAAFSPRHTSIRGPQPETTSLCMEVD